MIKHETELTMHQEILKHSCCFAIDTLQSLLYDLGAFDKPRHMFIEHSYGLVRDGLEHPHEASIFLERIAIQVFAGYLFFHEFVQWGGERRRIKGKVGNGRNRERTCPLQLKTTRREMREYHQHKDSFISASLNNISPFIVLSG